MATNFPTSLDSLTNPTSGDPLTSPSHSAQHANVNDAVEALEAKVGINSSAVTSSHDYKIAQLEAGATGGKILQVVHGTTSTEVSSTVAAYVTTNITATITPSSASNKVLAIWSTTARKDTTVYSGAYYALFRGTVAGTQLGNMRWYDVDNGSSGGVGYAYLDSPSTTSAQVYTVGLRTFSTATTVYANAYDTLGSIVLMEVAA